MVCRIDLNLAHLYTERAPAWRDIIALLQALGRLRDYSVCVRLGAVRCSLDHAIRVITAEAQFAPRDPQPQPPRPTPTASADAPRRSEYTSRAKASDAPHRPGPNAGASRRPENTPPPRRTPPVAPPPGESVRFFLAKTGLSWPTTAGELKRARNRAMLKLQPDHRPNDPNANQEFRVFMEGFQALNQRVCGPA